MLLPPHIYQMRGKFFNHPGGQVGVIHTFATIGIVDLSLFGQQFLWKPPKVMWRQFCNCSFKSNTFIYSPFSFIRALSPPTATSQISLHFLATLWSRGRQDKWDLWSRQKPTGPWSCWRSGWSTWRRERLALPRRSGSWWGWFGRTNGWEKRD